MAETSEDPRARRPAGRSLRGLKGQPVEKLLTRRSPDGEDVPRLDKVAEKKLQALHSVGVENVLDLLLHYPRRHIDRTNQRTIAELQVGEESLVLATVGRSSIRQMKGRRTLVEVEVRDADGGRGTLRCTFFNQPWRAKQLSTGTRVVLFGKVEAFRGRLQMTNPVVDLVGDRTGRIVPIYPQSEKAALTTWEIGEWVQQALDRAGAFADPVPPDVLRRHDLVDRTTAIHGIHAPASMGDVAIARKRLVFDELLRVQLALVARKREIERTSVGHRHVVDGELVRAFQERLPYDLTSAQRRVIAEISADLAAPVPMHRLLQGDVGSGKTVVAVSALLAAVEGGHQGALMAPTEVLAEQHHQAVTALLEGFSLTDDANLFGSRQLSVALLTSRTTAGERKVLSAGLASGEVDIVIGTHALLEDAVAFSSLGVAVIDEQHRFGVEQRAALRAKSGPVPDVLVMTATPIPRTAAMTVYGDLDVSVLDQMPPGRTPIRTARAQGPLQEAEAWAHVRAEVAEGRQAYVVCPLVEGSDKLEVASATETYEELGGGELHGLRLGLLHGRVPARDKEQVMAAFRAGELDVLVATTVIEVGVDVPNTTVMVILDADRFGIAQLHQLRGRVGRGSAASACYLFGECKDEEGQPTEAAARLDALVESNDGFALAEVDLEMRGEGTLMSSRQKGRNDLRLASLRRDRDWVVKAREVAFALVDGPGGLDAHPGLADEVELLLGGDEGTAEAERTDYLLKS
ncbi:MAG: ATP-dependent DNA helicase RecG [Acidimicrobiales bacterium]